MTQPTKPNQPTPEAVLAAIKTLEDANCYWHEIVIDMDGEDERLEAVVKLAGALNGLALAVAADFGALACDEKKRADKSDDWQTRTTSYAQSLMCAMLAAQAECYAGAVEEAHDRFRDIARDLKSAKPQVGQDEYNQSEYAS